MEDKAIKISRDEIRSAFQAMKSPDISFEASEIIAELYNAVYGRSCRKEDISELLACIDAVELDKYISVMYEQLSEGEALLCLNKAGSETEARKNIDLRKLMNK